MGGQTFMFSSFFFSSSVGLGKGGGLDCSFCTLAKVAVTFLMRRLIALKFCTNKERIKGEFRYRVWYEFDKYSMCKER